MSFPLQTELLPSILRRVPRQPGVSWYIPWVCGRGWQGGRGDDPCSSSVQPGQLGGSGLHVELGATSSIQSGWAYSAGEGGGCRLVEGGLVQKLKDGTFFSTERKGMNGGHWEGKLLWDASKCGWIAQLPNYVRHADITLCVINVHTRPLNS